MRKPLRPRDVQSPDRILSNLLDDYINNRLGGDSFIFRAVVLKVDAVGGQLAGPSTDNPDEPPNPPGSIKCRIITDSINIHTPDADLPVFWPFFPFDLMPVKESEHVYCIYEDITRHHGLWLTRVAEPLATTNLNIAPGSKRYTDNTQNNLSPAVGAEQAVQGLDDDPGVAIVDVNFVNNEEVPNFLSRPGERDLAGSIDVVVGRASEDVSYGDDTSRILIARKTNVDTNFELNVPPLPLTTPSGAIVVKSDEIRIIGRKNIKIVSEEQGISISIDEAGNVNVTAKNINFNAEHVNIGAESASHPLVHGDALKDFLKAVLDVLVVAPVDVGGIPFLGIVNPSVKIAIDAQLATFETQVLSSKNNTD